MLPHNKESQRVASLNIITLWITPSAMDWGGIFFLILPSVILGLGVSISLVSESWVGIWSRGIFDDCVVASYFSGKCLLGLLLCGRVSVTHTRQIIITNWWIVKTVFTTILQSTGILICLILCRYWSSLEGGKVSTLFSLVLAEIFNSINSFQHPLRLRMKKKS